MRPVDESIHNRLGGEIGEEFEQSHDQFGDHDRVYPVGVGPVSIKKI
jgi:hypothetical protein